jgi:hypothetical protein
MKNKWSQVNLEQFVNFLKYYKGEVRKEEDFLHTYYYDDTTNKCIASAMHGMCDMMYSIWDGGENETLDLVTSMMNRF